MAPMAQDKSISPLAPCLLHPYYSAPVPASIAAKMASPMVVGFVGLDELSLELASSLVKSGYRVQGYEVEVNDPEGMNGFLDLATFLILLQNKLATLSSTSKPNRLLHSLLHFLLLLLPLQAKNTSFDSSFSFSNLTFLGDGSIAIVCNLPIQFYDPVTNISASFSTKFSFSIPNPQSSGDGLTFFISPDNRTIGSTGGYLGLFNSSGGIKNGSVVTVEFDTRLGDRSDNHVGLEIDTTISLQSVDIGVYGIVPKTNALITVWIQFHNDEKKLEIWLGYSNIKPPNPIFSTKIDLSEHFQEFMYVGFSASTEESTELYMVKDWFFEIFGFTSPTPTSNFSNSYTSDKPSSMIPEIPSSSSGKKIFGFGLIIVIVIVGLFLVLLFAWILKFMWFNKKT